MSINKINDLSLHNHAIAAQLHEAARRVIDSGWYAMGPEVSAFEEAFARYCGTTQAIGVANGTDAIELALRATGVSIEEARDNERRPAKRSVAQRPRSL